MKIKMNLERQDCSEITSNVHRSLCQTLSLPIERDAANPDVFTGYPTTDILILEELSDRDLINVCATNKYLNGLCNNESFWMNRVLQKYGDLLGSGVYIGRNYIPMGTTWKQYYIWLGDLEHNVIKMDELQSAYNREDLEILSHRPVYLSINAKNIFGRIYPGLLAFSHGISTPRIIMLALERYERINGVSPGTREIISHGVIPYSDLSPERQTVLQNPAIQKRLNLELSGFGHN